MCDVAHIAGLMAAGVIPSAFPYADIVTTTTHKTLRGPRGALVFARKKHEHAINSGVFPAIQGGPHNHTIGAIAVAMRAAAQPEFKAYQQQVLDNSQSLARTLVANKFRLVTGGTDNHLVLLDLSPQQIKGNRAESILERVNIIANKNTVLSDKSAKNPSGLRLGTPAMTTRGMGIAEAELLGIFITQTLQLCKEIEKANRGAQAFAGAVAADKRLDRIRAEVIDMAHKFPVPSSALWPGPADQSEKPTVDSLAGSHTGRRQHLRIFRRAWHT